MKQTPGPNSAGVCDSRHRPYAKSTIAVAAVAQTARDVHARQLRHRGAKPWACEWLTTIGQAYRAVSAETLRTTFAWAIDQVAEKSQKTPHIMVQLGLN